MRLDRDGTVLSDSTADHDPEPTAEELALANLIRAYQKRKSVQLSNQATELVRHVRSQRGVEFYGLPIGSPIVGRRKHTSSPLTNHKGPGPKGIQGGTTTNREAVAKQDPGYYSPAGPPSTLTAQAMPDVMADPATQKKVRAIAERAMKVPKKLEPSQIRAAEQMAENAREDEVRKLAAQAEKSGIFTHEEVEHLEARINLLHGNLDAEKNAEAKKRLAIRIAFLIAGLLASFAIGALGMPPAFAAVAALAPAISSEIAEYKKAP